MKHSTRVAIARFGIHIHFGVFVGYWIVSRDANPILFAALCVWCLAGWASYYHPEWWEVQKGKSKSDSD